MAKHVHLVAPSTVGAVPLFTLRPWGGAALADITTFVIGLETVLTGHAGQTVRFRTLSRRVYIQTLANITATPVLPETPRTFHGI